MIICAACPAPTSSNRLEAESGRDALASMRERTRTPVSSVKVINPSRAKMESGKTFNPKP